ncbi:MAG TPA: hypothetical protein VMU36_05885 [Spirochaetia bacterium]|nr:hypothetical protein [Spirochaetia bacterium]
MRGFVSIEVEAYAGYKAAETPRAFVLQGRRFVIEEIVDRWYQADRDPTIPPADYFKVRSTDGGLFVIRRDNETQEWSLREGDAPT